MAPWYRGNIALEDGILAEFDRKPAPAKFRAAAKEYEVSLAGLGKLASRLEEQVKTEASAPKVPAFEQALSKVDRKSTRLNSSHMSISYAVFCLKKKKKKNKQQ